MYRTLKLLGSGLIAMMVMAGCSSQPVQQMSETKAALDAVVAEGAEKYAQEDMKTLNDAYAAAMEEVKIQDGKLLKNYDEVADRLAELEARADALKASIPAKKEKAKSDALTAQAEAKAAAEDARRFLTSAPVGKGSQADIEAMKADLAGIDTSLTEVEALIEGEDYLAAIEKSTAISGKAKEISGQINLAMQKVAK